MSCWSLTKKTLTILTLLAIVAGLSLFYIWRPSYSGVIHHSRDYGTVSIYRDDFAVPHIVAKDLKSAQYGLGFSHCQDRLWNMDIFRRVASGRMSELFGNATLETDILMRELGLKHAADQMRQTVSPALFTSLQAYADGINECVSKMPVLPIEYAITQSSFAPWEIVDSLYFYKMLVFQLSCDWPFELVREQLMKLYGRVTAEEMFGNRRLFDNTTIMNDDELKLMGLFKSFDFSSIERDTPTTAGSISAEALQSLVQTGLVDFLSASKGSNGWAIHGNYTSTGLPIIANDPHLFNGVPVIWSQAVIHLKTSTGEEQVVSGGSMPGSGFIFSGMTNYFAWSVTTLYTDSSDLYKEKISENGKQYLLDGIWRDLKISEEPIKVKGTVIPHTLTIKSTHRGHILTRDEMSVSLAWIGSIGKEDRTLESLNLFYEVKSLDQLKKLLHGVDAPPQALTFGTIDGHIGFFGNGKHQVHATPYQGAFIQDGTTSKNDWVRLINEEEQPRLYDPPKGYIVTGNNKWASDNVSNMLGLSSATTSRGLRITQMIEGYIRNGTKITPENIKNMQSDVLDSFAEKIHPTWVRLYHKHKGRVLNTSQIVECDEMVKAVESWDFRVEKDAVAPTIYYAVDLFLSKKLIPQYAKNVQDRLKVSAHFFFDHFKLRSMEDWMKGERLNEIWCENKESILEDEHCIYNFIVSFSDAYAFLKDTYNTSSISAWTYGFLHHSVYPHTPFSRTALKPLFERSYSSKGSKFTVHVSSKDFANESWNGIWGANYKMIASLDQKNSKSYYIIDTGVSGNVMSPHYDDQMELYKRGEYLTINREKKDYEKFQKLTLIREQEKDSDL